MKALKWIIVAVLVVAAVLLGARLIVEYVFPIVFPENTTVAMWVG